MSAVGHALHVGEAAVLDAWDAGLTIEQVAEKVGKTRKFVAKIISQYDGAEDARRTTAVRTGCLAYAAALIATGKVYA